MKNKMKIFLMAALLALLSLPAHAYDVKIGGIYYYLDNYATPATAMVTSGDNLYTGNVVIPKSIVVNGVTYSVTSLGDCCFYDCSSLTSINLPSSVTSLGRFCFYGCSSLTSIEIPSSVTSLGDYCFEGCSFLRSIEIPSSVTSLGERCFYGCSFLRSIEIPSSVTSLGNTCFAGCSSLTSINLPSSVTSLGERCFDDCSSLRSINLPSSVTSLGNLCFYGCSSLTSIEIPSSVTSLGDYCFSGCSSLRSINLPSSVTSLGKGCFSGCSFLRSIEIPSSVTSLGDYCFEGCSFLKSIEIPSSVTSLGNTCFAGCSSLTSINLPSSVTSLGDYCFSGCSSLTSIEIPSSVTSLGNNCFSGCKSLESIVVDAANPKYDSREGCNAIIETESNTMIVGCPNTRIPSSVTSLGNHCFHSCSKLASIDIPSSVTSLGRFCFYNCSGLTSVVSKIKEPFEFGELCFYAIPSSCTLTVPHGKRDAYMATGWTESIFRGGIVEAPYDPASDNYLSLSDATACNGCSMVLPVDMHNSEAITALQFELSLPTGVTLSDCLLTGRKGDHTVSYSRLSNGNYQVIVFSMNNRNFLGSEGALLELSLDVDEGVPSGDYPVVVKNIELTTSDTQPVNPDDARATLTVSDVKPADANGDGKISVTDVVSIVNYILGKRTEGFRFAAADMDGNGKITITDAVAVVNKILGSDASAKERGTAARLDPQ